MSGVLNPLQSVELHEIQDDLLETDTTTAPTLGPDHTSVVLHWSVEQVKHWLEHSVHLEPHRLQVIEEGQLITGIHDERFGGIGNYSEDSRDQVWRAHTYEITQGFVSQGVDGLTLLTLHQSHHACAGMTDSEWLVLKVARRWLMAQGERPLVTMPAKVKTIETSIGTPPSTPQSAKSDRAGTIRDYYEKANLLSPRKAWTLPRIYWGPVKDDQEEALEREVQSLRGEIVGAEERETTHLAQLDHVDDLLRTSQLATYLFTRTRWTAISGEPPVDDTDVDDWLLRFLVFRGSSICFYLHATDLRPQGTIMRSEIVDIGLIPNSEHHQGDTSWSAFHITTCHGLRLECASLLKLQVDCWLSVINSGYNYGDLWKSNSTPQPPAWQTVLPAKDSDPTLGDEGALFGEIHGNY